MHRFFWIFIALAILPGLAIAASKDKSTPPDSELVYRANLGSADDLSLLIEQGGNINAVDNNGIGLVFLAAGRPDEEGVNVVHALLKHGVDINSRDVQGRTALFFAAKSGNSKTVDYLLKNGADPYITDNNGDVARNYAYKFGHMNVVEQMDDFARKRIAEVNSAYERVNNELQKRYDELAKEQRNIALREQKANTPRQRAKPKSEPKPEPAPAPKYPAPQDNAEEPAMDAGSADEEAAAKKTAAEHAALEKRARVTASQEADNLMRAELEAERASAKATRRQEMQEERDAAEELRRTMQDAMRDINMEAHLKSEIEAEAALLKREQEERERNNPELRKARLAAERQEEEARAELFRQLSYNSCQYQYWYFCYTSKMTTDVPPEELREIMDTSKQNVVDLQDTLIHDHDVKASSVQNVSLTGKTRIFNQLNRMRSATQRRSEGVGTIEDAERRCGDIALNWDIDARSMVDERPRKSTDDDGADGGNRPIPVTPSKGGSVSNYSTPNTVTPSVAAQPQAATINSSKKSSAYIRNKKSGTATKAASTINSNYSKKYRSSGKKGSRKKRRR